MLVLVVHKLGSYSFILRNFLLDIWMDVSPLFRFVLELCQNIIIENQKFMTNWWFWNSTGINPIYLNSLSFQRHLYSKHDFVAAIRSLFKNIIAYHYRYPRYINFLRLMFRPEQKTRRQRLYIFRLHRRSLPITGILKQRTRYLNAQINQKKIPSSQENLGGYGARIFSYQFLEPYITSNSSNISTTAHFRFVDHVDNIKLLNFPEGEYIHATIPLYALFELLPVLKAREVASTHGISAGSRCNQAQLLNATVDHSCLACATYSSIFVADKNSAQLHVDNVVKSRKKQDQKKSKNLKNIVHEFPPKISDDHCHTIISNACKKLNKDNIEEAGCAVCGELKPLKNLSRIRNIKNMLHILSTPGVTRIERKNLKSPVREYSGPVLDYTCNCVCDHCRSSIRNGKIPHLALANNLWLGKVPEELKNLRFVEKLLIARV
jgi:hypothetical protein